MADGARVPEGVAASAPRPVPGLRWVEMQRRGPILRPAALAAPGSGLYGIDLTAGCGLACPFCHIRNAPWYPGEDRVLFDPAVADRLATAVDALPEPPGLVVLSPTSEPLPAHREARRVAYRVLRQLLEREIKVVLMTRGRISSKLIGLLADHRSAVTVAPAVVTLDRALSRVLEPRATPPAVRVGRIARLIEAGVPVEIRLEPLIAGLTDTREAVFPLFEALARAGARRIIAHYLFLHPAMLEPLRAALRPLGLAEKLEDDYQGGPLLPVGSLGPTKHLPLETRRAGLARLAAWGAEFELTVVTGTAQNPDLPRAGGVRGPAPGPEPVPSRAWPRPKNKAHIGSSDRSVEAVG